ncbi:MAG: FHA domain-containing protein [Acidobacteriota bacterium]
MTNPATDWYCADADEHGFVGWDYVQRQAARTTRDAFVAEFPVPALMVVYRGVDQAESEGMDPNQSGVQLLTMSVKSAAVLRYLSRVAFVCKRPGNPFAHLISIGRSNNNDITLAVDSVSKVHGYVVSESDAWQFTDHGSTNGSRLGGQRLEANTKAQLNDGDVLQLGLEVMLEFLLPATLYDRAKTS